MAGAWVRLESDWLPKSRALALRTSGAMVDANRAEHYLSVVVLVPIGRDIIKSLAMDRLRTVGSCFKEESMSEVMQRLNVIFQDVFDNDQLIVTPTTTARDVEEWDSLMHVSLIVNVERSFKIRFSSSEVAALKSVGELADLVQRRLQAA